MGALTSRAAFAVTASVLAILRQYARPPDRCEVLEFVELRDFAHPSIAAGTGERCGLRPAAVCAFAPKEQWRLTA